MIKKNSTQHSVLIVIGLLFSSPLSTCAQEEHLLREEEETPQAKKPTSSKSKRLKKKRQKEEAQTDIVAIDNNPENSFTSRQEGEELDRAERLFEKGFDKEQKKRDAIALANKAANFFEENDLTTACHAFTHSKEFLLGELYVFLFDTKGSLYAYGKQEQSLWQNWYNDKDQFGSFFVQELIKGASTGGSWVTYEYKDSVKSSYVRTIEKDGKSYILGCGFYTHSKNDLVIGLVKGAAAFFKEEIKKNRPVDEIFSTFSYPLSGRFLIGDLYLYALDFEGNIVAQGDRPGLIGTNALNYKDANNTYTNKEIIKKLKEKNGSEGVWVEYISKRAPKQAYAEQVTDSKGKSYFIACGYYPEANKEKMIDLVARGYQYMKSHGPTAAKTEFSGQSDDFRFGDLYLFVYDTKGTVIADGNNDELVGRNHWELKDDEGDFYVQELINNVLKGDSEHQSAWLNHRFKNAFQSIYAERVKMGTETYIIGSSIYPLSKRETMMLLAKSAAEYLKENSREIAFQAFSKQGGPFLRGELGVFVLDTDGTCYVWSDDMKMIWKNLYNWNDEDGRPFIQLMINAVEHGPSKVIFKRNKRTAVAHVEKVEKDEKSYIVGSSFYL